MAGSKSAKSREDKTKKRKRDTIEADQESKRHRKDQKTQKAKQGLESPAAVTKGRSTLQKLPISDVAQLSPGQTTVLKPTQDEISAWRISKPMGGRVLDIDPIMTEDEENLIIAYNTSIQVYSAADSLLVRRIPIHGLDNPSSTDSKASTIVAAKLSKRNSDLVWVACSDGRVISINWRQPLDVPPEFKTGSGTAKALSLVPIGSKKSGEEAVLVLESDKTHRLDLTAYLLDSNTNVSTKSLFSLKKPGHGLQLIETSQDGTLLVGALNDRLFIGAASGSAHDSFDQLSYEIFSFDAPDLITTLDFKVDKKMSITGGSRPHEVPDSEGSIDIIAGGARGAIYLYPDAISRARATGQSKSDKEALQAQKYHWHRKAVHSVKWSRDGNYMISGGSENVLVIWQMDTSKTNFLPHLSGSVENIVVSATGASYVVHLDDNSVMVVSTAELKPTTYISGIQSPASYVSTPKDMLVRRTWSTADKVRRKVPAAIRSTEPSQLHVCVGSGQQATMSGVLSAPLLQSFDLDSFTSINRQPLARTQPTDLNLSTKGLPIEEPLITHLSFSSDGQWLASVDVWNPPRNDIDQVVSGLKDQFIRERQEVYLKFWQMGSSESSAALVSRINMPHATDQPESVLDLAADPKSPCFATIGADGMVRVWRPRLRQQDGMPVKGANGVDTFTWACSQVVPVGDGLGEDAVELPDSTNLRRPQGALAFSEDGSVIFAAYGATDSGVVYIIDASSGEIVRTLEDLWTGSLRSMRALSPFILILSNELRVFDVVGDELRYGITIPEADRSGDLLQLAVDYTSRHFAVSAAMHSASIMGVFDPESAGPLLVRALPHPVVSLVSTPNKSGFLALDDAAQIWTVTEGSDASSLTAMQPLTDLRLDQAETNGAVRLEEDAEMASDDEDDTGAVKAVDDDIEMGDEDDDDMHAAVVAQQHLADIFDAAPAFAAPSIEDMFYKVTDLLGAKPLLAAMK